MWLKGSRIIMGKQGCDEYPSIIDGKWHQGFNRCSPRRQRLLGPLNSPDWRILGPSNPKARLEYLRALKLSGNYMDADISKQFQSVCKLC